MSRSSPDDRRRVAIVTGGSGGIGQSVVHRLANRGHVVVIADRDGVGSEIVAEKLASEGLSVRARELDVSSDREIAAFWTWLDATYERADILVNCAGFARLDPLTTLSLPDWETTLSVNVTGPMRMAQAAAPLMARHRWGRIVNVTSVSGVRASWGRIGYGTSKAALNGLTRQLAVELAREGIAVNAVAPGPVTTAMSAASHSAATVDAYHRMVPMGRYATPDEVGAAIDFLCSEDAGYITGHVLPVDGGFLAAGVLDA